MAYGGFTPMKVYDAQLKGIGADPSPQASDDFNTWLANQSVEMQTLYYAAQAANPSDKVPVAVKANTLIPNVPNWVVYGGAALLTLSLVFPPRR